MPKTGQAAVVGGRRVSRRGRKIERDAKHVRRRNSSAMAFRGGRERVGARPRWLSLTHVRGTAQEDAEPEGYEDELSEWAQYLHTFADEADESSDEPEDEPVTPVASPKGSAKGEKYFKTPAHTFKNFSLGGGAGMKGLRRAGQLKQSASRAGMPSGMQRSFGIRAGPSGSPKQQSPGGGGWTRRTAPRE